jgi:hypothetical protein
MKNDMKLIMESWRSSALLMENDPHSDGWMGTITVGDFLASITAGDNPNKMKQAEKAMQIIKEKYPKVWGKLSGEQQSKWELAWPKIFNSFTEAGESEGTGYIAGLISSGISTKTIAAIAAKFIPAVVGAAVFTQLFLACAAVLTTIGVAWGINKLYKMAIDATRSVKAMAALDIPDGELGTNDAANAYDISDSTKAVIYGPDKKLDKAESVALALGYKELAEWTKKLQDKLNSLTAQDAIDFKNSTLASQNWTKSINTIVRQKYGEILGLQQNTTIPKTP